MTTISLRYAVPSRTRVRALVLIIVAMVALLYLEWRTSQVAPNGAVETDTMCIAARIGLSCRS
jgi:ABC-type microcin C transport system permease subunit YejB